MPRYSLRAAIFAVLISVTTSAPASQASAPRLDDVIDRVTQYVAGYEKAFSSVVAREEYRQELLVSGRRESRVLRSEIALIALIERDWLFFRDVYELDGRRLADRGQRLETLFLKPTPDLVRRAQMVVEDSTRFNLGGIERTINNPTQFLEFLRKANVGRSTFKLAGRTRLKGREAQEVRFVEQARPRLITTRDGAAAEGRFWADAETGVVLKTDLRITTAGLRSQIVVEYGEVKALRMWAPMTMTEFHQQGVQSSASLPTDKGGILTIDAHARYSDFRQFQIDTRTIVR